MSSKHRSYRYPPGLILLVLCISSSSLFADPPYAPRMQFGKYKGQPIDVSTRRSVTILEATSTTVKIDNFFHRGRFWTAEIPVQEVAEVVGQQFNFSSNGKVPLINHVQARFIMNPSHPVRLTARDDSGDTAQVDDFVSSVEAVGPAGVGWNFWDAALGQLVNAHRFVSTEQVVLDRIITERYLIPQNVVALNAAERTTSLMRLLNDANNAAMGQPYYLFRLFGRSANCTSTKFHALDGVVQYRSVCQRLLADVFGDLPISPRLYLALRGRLGAARPTLNDEFADRIAAGEFTNPSWSSNPELGQ